MLGDGIGVCCELVTKEVCGIEWCASEIDEKCIDEVEAGVSIDGYGCTGNVG